MLKENVINIFRSANFERQVALALEANDFFTPQSIAIATQAIIEALPEVEVNNSMQGRRIGVVAAGNIPLVGFFDMYNALVTGAEVFVKPSRRDPLMRAFSSLAHMVDRLPENVDIILAMGSDSAMQFLRESYPASRLVLRGHERSAAVLTGDESSDRLALLARDMFLHSAMGCRSVTHLHLPLGYDMGRLCFGAPGFDLPSPWYDNYRLSRARVAMSGGDFIDCGYYILREGFHDHLGVVGYTYYNSVSSIDFGSDVLKSIVADRSLSLYLPCLPTDFGCGQFPAFEFLDFRSL
ncbi:MAG: hypothetical protein RR980_05185 [Mucinivorans sp.]